MSQHESSGEWLVSWRDRVVDAAGFRCSPMALAESRSWSFRDGAIRHSSNRFFSVIGVEDESGHTYPLLDQPEIGLLGFLVAGPPTDTHWLAQMKIEPGNVGIAQLAPTVQVTRSNLDRVHGGSPPPLADRIHGATPNYLSDGLWSEQGTRFLAKRNRNVTASISQTSVETGLHHRWIARSELQEGLATAYAVNTDARSVIATAPWRLIGGSNPFTGDLRRSYLHHDPDAADRVRKAITDAQCPHLQRIPLEDLRGATLDDGEVPLRHPVFDIVHRSVAASTRETPAWDQPLVASGGPGRIMLLLRHGPDGILRAALGIDRSPGLAHGPELTATLVVSPGDRRPVVIQGRTIAETEISDEGGRFEHETSTVTIIVGNDCPETGPHVELTLGDLESVMRTPMATTNELRTAAALLLSLA